MLEKQADLGLANRVIISLNQTQERYEIVHQEKWLDNIHVPFNLMVAQRSPDKVHFFTTLVADALIFAGNILARDTKVVEAVRDDLLLGRVNTEIALPLKITTVDHFLIEPYVKVLGRCAYSHRIWPRNVLNHPRTVPKEQPLPQLDRTTGFL
jgi:hypothetical protein